MDTISYLPNPTDPSRVANVVEDYSKFDLNDSIAIARTLRSTNFDRFDCNNDDSTKNWFFDSLDPSLQKDIQY